MTPSAAFGPGTPAQRRRSPNEASDGSLRATVPRQALLPREATDFTLDLIVNEITADRERRRGQLVLSGADGEWIYLRGDRQDAPRALPFHLSND